MDGEAEDEYSSLIFVAFFTVALFHLLLKTEKVEPNLKDVPVAGYQNYLLSYFDAFRFPSRGIVQLRRGLSKYGGRTFRLSLLNHWLVILPSRTYIEDLRKAPEGDVSFAQIADEFDPSLDPIGHYSAITHGKLGDLTRHVSQNIAFLIPVVREEMNYVFEKIQVDDSAGNVLLEDSTWQEVDASRLVTELTVQVVNRLILGLPFARDEYLRNLSTSLTLDAFEKPFLERFLPKTFVLFLRPLRRSYQYRQRISLLIFSFLLRRKDALNFAEHKEEHEDYDLLSSLLRHGNSQKLSEDITSDIADLAVTASRMISLTFAQVLYHLAANPGYSSPMQKEVESLVRQNGWSKEPIERMHKVDSFIKESMRMKSVYCVTTLRKTIQPFAFSDGSHLPPGTLSAVPVEPRHFDSTSYYSPDVFDGLRFFRLHEQNRMETSATYGRMNSQFQLVTTSVDYLAWGYGRHACPGRFFSATVLKTMLAHVLMYYEVKFEKGVEPKDVFVGLSRLPDPNVKMLIRKRRS